MARYDTEHKAQTRARVVDAAGRRLKKDGIDGSGVSALMSDAGLTNGAFYAHFSSKDELVAVVLADHLANATRHSSGTARRRSGIADFHRELSVGESS